MCSVLDDLPPSPAEIDLCPLGHDDRASVCRVALDCARSRLSIVTIAYIDNMIVRCGPRCEICDVSEFECSAPPLTVTPSQRNSV